MEMQQKQDRAVNVYVDPREQVKTEDIYQTLQTPPTVAVRNASGKKILVPLLIIIILLLSIILLVMVIHNYHIQQCGAGVLNNQKRNQEMWFLHDESFYLFWSNQGDCDTAVRFCTERMASLAAVTDSNRDWLQSQINIKRMLVKMDEPHGSGDRFFMDVDEASACKLFSVTSDLSEQPEGWVCEIKALQKIFLRGMW